MRLYKHISIILLCLISMTPTHGKTKLSLHHIIEQTLQTNYSIRIQNKELTILKNTSTISEAGLVPNINASYSYTRSSEDTEYNLSSGDTLSGSDASSSYETKDITLSQTLTNIINPLHEYKKLKQVYHLSDLHLQQHAGAGHLQYFTHVKRID